MSYMSLFGNVLRLVKESFSFTSLTSLTFYYYILPPRLIISLSTSHLMKACHRIIQVTKEESQLDFFSDDKTVEPN